MGTKGIMIDVYKKIEYEKDKEAFFKKYKIESDMAKNIFDVLDDFNNNHIYPNNFNPIYKLMLMSPKFEQFTIEQFSEGVKEIEKAKILIKR
ncbi:hypothetical protein R4J03_09105 [Brachyspira intermedia]|uniref:hypothetical protein n=1 Tax=Brachyspira intermedia TaxID=84377 RepID=UPI002620B232|nr:hypothetical protein [uncultured Brachyspira sp.]